MANTKRLVITAFFLFMALVPSTAFAKGTGDSISKQPPTVNKGCVNFSHDLVISGVKHGHTHGYMCPRTSPMTIPTEKLATVKTCALTGKTTFIPAHSLNQNKVVPMDVVRRDTAAVNCGWGGNASVDVGVGAGYGSVMWGYQLSNGSTGIWNAELPPCNDTAFGCDGGSFTDWVDSGVLLTRADLYWSNWGFIKEPYANCY